MTKAELIDEIKAESRLNGRKLTQLDVEAMLTALDHTVARELAIGGYVPLPGIGVLEAKKRKARKGRNHRIGAEITIPACKMVRLRVAGSLKAALNQ